MSSSVPFIDKAVIRQTLHDANCDLDYILKSIRTFYAARAGNGEIRRINVNIAATTAENYRRLKTAGIGTYILFQETYDPDVYAEYHLSGPKSDYAYHTTAFDRAQQGGIDDVGGGVLFGHGDPLFETLARMIHNEYLEKTYGVGFHDSGDSRTRKHGQPGPRERTSIRCQCCYAQSVADSKTQGLQSV